MRKPPFLRTDDTMCSGSSLRMGFFYNTVVCVGYVWERCRWGSAVEWREVVHKAYLEIVSQSLYLLDDMCTQPTSFYIPSIFPSPLVGVGYLALYMLPTYGLEPPVVVVVLGGPPPFHSEL